MATDTERLDWVNEWRADVIAGIGTGLWFVYINSGHHRAATLREVIDAAMSASAIDAALAKDAKP